MTPNIRHILEDCIERGIEEGMQRAHKHIDNPTDATLTDHLQDGIWFYIDQCFSFEDGW